MSFIPPNEKIIEQKLCRISWQEFFVTDKDLEFYDKISPIFAGEKYSIPSPTISPEERQKRRLVFRNERKFYHRKCDKTGNQIISIYSPEKPYIVYDQNIWRSDDWSPLDYGIDFDFSRQFFPQFGELFQRTPKMNLFHQAQNENSEYSHLSSYNKNCYLLTAWNENEDCYYTTYVQRNKNIIDSCFIFDSENCYSSIDCKNCYNIFYSSSCVWSQDLYLCEDCQECQHCIGCSGLNHKTYHVLNRAVSESQYREIISSHEKLSEIKKYFQKVSLSIPKKVLHGVQNENVTGDYLLNSKNSYNCFDCTYLEDCKNCTWLHKATNCHDHYAWGLPAELCYENQLVWNGGRMVRFSLSCMNNCQDLLYCADSTSINNCFGCSSLNGKQHHCIFNKTYSTQEYEYLCSRIIDHMISTGEWWEFFPHELSPFGYNETVAGEYFPMAEEEIKSLGWNWRPSEEMSSYHGPYYTAMAIENYDEKKVGHEEAQKNINELLNGILLCEKSNKPFKVIKQELVFYIENHIAIPTKHPDERHKERMSQRNPRIMHERICDKCPKEIITTYCSERQEKVVCEECYRKLIY
jgi:hypothetical protein